MANQTTLRAAIEAVEKLRDICVRADSYLSLFWHRFVPNHAKDTDLRLEVDRLLGELRSSYEGRNRAPLFDILTAALAQPDAGEWADPRVDQSVIKRSYGWVLSVDGEVHGLVAGDQGYEPTGIRLEDTPPPPQSSLTREVCICAAIKLPDGRVINGHRHHNCFAAIAELASVDPSIPSRSERFEQGFTTSHRRFVNREEGLALQLAAGIPSADPVRKGYGNQLFSEDLY